MACEYCRGEGYHVPRCPNFVPLKAAYYCSICDEGIYYGDQYIENYNGDHAHWDCINGIHGLLEFLDCEIKTMEE